MGWYRTKCSMFSDLLCYPSELSFLIHPPEFSALVAVDTPSSEAGRNLVTNVHEFCLLVFLSYFKGSFTRCKILQHRAVGITSPPKEVMLWTFIALKRPLLLARFEPMKHGYNGKHVNHYTTKNNSLHLASGLFETAQLLGGSTRLLNVGGGEQVWERTGS
jgi:hypothetical protein